MANPLKRKQDSGIETIEEFQGEREAWISEMAHLTWDIHFFKKFLKAPLFRPVPDLYEKISGFLKELNTCKEELQELNQEIQNHRFDLEKMLECDDVSCDNFYLEQHKKLENQVKNFSNHMRNLQSQIVTYTSDLLIEDKNQN